MARVGVARRTEDPGEIVLTSVKRGTPISEDRRQPFGKLRAREQTTEDPSIVYGLTFLHTGLSIQYAYENWKL